MIEVSGLRKSFDGMPVLKDVRLQVPRGGVTALVGPSGSGKSTLLRCLNLLEVPEAGRLQVGDVDITFNGQRPAAAHVARLRGQTGMVFQNFQLFPHLRVLDNVTEALVTVQRWERQRANERALDLLGKVGLADKADAWPGTLSGGQQQRVAIARALAPSPQVLLCDEPTSALDPTLAAEVVQVLQRLAEDGMTMVMATHDLRLAARVATQAVFLHSGEVVEAGEPQALFGQPRDARTQAFVAVLREAATF